MEHINHIKRTISVHMVNLQQKISSWLISNVSMRFILSQNYFLWILNDDDATCWDLAPRADFREVAALLPLDQEAGVRDDNLHRACFLFLRQSPDWNLPNLARMCWIAGKTWTDRKKAWVLLLSLFGNDLGRLWSRAMCMAMQIFYLVCSNAGCQWIIDNFLNF